MAGGRLLAEEVRDGPAPLRPEDATPGLAIGWWYLRRSAGAGSSSGGVAVLPVPRQSGRRLIPRRSRRCGQLECVGLPDNRAVALDGVAQRTPLIRLVSAGVESLPPRCSCSTRHSTFLNKTTDKTEATVTTRLRGLTPRQT